MTRIMFLELFQRYASWKVAAALSLASIPAAYIYRYRRSIKKRLKELEDPVDILIRVKDTSAGEGRFRVLELNPDFVKLHSDKWKLQSIGHYLSTLQPSSDLPDAPEFVRREMDSFLAGMLLHQLGPNIGAAILPLLGFPNIQSTTAKIAARVANWFASRFIVDAAAKEDPALDKGIIPFSLYDLSSFANLNQTLRENTMDTSPVDYLKQGEVYSPSFQSANLIPNPFVVEEHWDKAIQGMEELLRKAHEQDASAEGDETPAYDPHDRSMPKPTPFNQRLFPDLYLGWGSAKCTHTKREIICNKLLCVLLNRLSHNYFKIEQANAEQLFVVKLKSKEKHDIITAQDLVEALFESGHTIEVCPRASLTTFGVAACIKEDDGSWTNIPLAYFFKTGYENPKARAAHVCVPHGGMDLSISGGPLVGDAKCNIQFYMAIEGMAGWHSNHNADVPWVVPTSATEPYSKEGALRAVRMASFLAVTFNALGTELNLPFGGYGVLGVCNDTAALLDQALRGTTNMYPLVSTGRFLMHIARRLGTLRERLLDSDPTLKEDVEDLLRLAAATMDIPSDLHAAPSNVLSGARRYLHSIPETCTFRLEAEGKEIMTNMLERFEEFREKKIELEKMWNWKKPIKSFRQHSVKVS